ncbi:NHLP leader peptide family natural product precursor [Rudanella paleaurantiibacter]|uniref:NHLP leader peptide family natural product n=1 Tax=Rudanella paleaurantiibacter TaxID=2614655 RepID=A0A7J5TRW1_9BACT|nr:NHLP leader peptide family RiPP precursor [Rudanella paleaurantiibacter]KAB7725721.1 NHLP leader peptide family natural product precursor [Rudanella paleaurantiibacter]
MEQRKQEIIEAVISKAWEDANFKTELIADPVKAIEKLTGVKVVLPEGKSLVFLDQTDKSTIYVNIPAEPEIENMELTEEQLEAVAGGGQRIWGDFIRNLFPNLNDCITL